MFFLYSTLLFIVRAVVLLLYHSHVAKLRAVPLNVRHHPCPSTTHSSTRDKTVEAMKLITTKTLAKLTVGVCRQPKHGLHQTREPAVAPCTTYIFRPAVGTAHSKVDLLLETIV